MILLHLVKPDVGEVFLGYLPSKTLVQPGALYVGVGIIGGELLLLLVHHPARHDMLSLGYETESWPIATVMPHALFLGSSLASVDRLNMVPRPPVMSAKRSFHLPSLQLWSRLRRRQLHSAQGNSNDGAIEMQPYVPRQQQQGAASSSRASLGAVDESVKPVYLEGEEREERQEVKDEYEMEVKRYETEVKKFDRIKWAEIHILHATVSLA